GEDHAVLINWRGTVDAVRVGSAVIFPEEVAVGRRDAENSPASELDVLALAAEIKGNGGSIGGSRISGHLASPNGFAGRFIERNERGVFSARCADDVVAIHERGFAEAPGGQAAGKILLQTDLPNDAAIFDLQTNDIAGQAFDIQ